MAKQIDAASVNPARDLALAYGSYVQARAIASRGRKGDPWNLTAIANAARNLEVMQAQVGLWLIDPGALRRMAEGME